MNRKQRRKIRRIAGKIRGWILTAMAIMAAYLVLCGVGITEMPEWGPDWYPVQICMVVIGGGWLIMFMAANGAFDEMDLYDDEDEEDEHGRSRDFHEWNGSRSFSGCTNSGSDRTGNGKTEIMRKRKSALCMGSP